MNTNEGKVGGDSFAVEALKNRDQGSMAELYTRYYPRVYQLCYSFSKNRDDAFDLAQDILLKAFTRISSFEGASTFSTWLFSIARNHCINHLRQRNREIKEDVKSSLECFSDEGYEGYEERENLEQMEMKLVSSLHLIPEFDRRMLNLKYQHNYSVKELQREFSLSASAVKMRLLRARHRAEQAMLVREVA